MCKKQYNLSRHQKRDVLVLSVGTFLEYFDLMLYVHMAVLLNELFFPKADPYMKSIITASVFCSTYIVRPIGALIFGWIGDNLGRRVSLMCTTFLMSIACIIMSALPTYSEIGVTASILVTICRIIQGMSSMGEIVGAQLYIAETVNVPARYPAVSFIPFAASVGSFGALGVASMVFYYPTLSWRYAFLIGAVIAGVGWFARNILRETPEFVNAKRQNNIKLTKVGNKNSSSWRTLLSVFALDSMWPICFYFTYIYCSEILYNNFGYSAMEVINNNLIVSIFQMMMDLTFIILTFRVHPLKLLQIKAFIIGILFLSFPFWIDNISDGFYITIFQCLIVFFAPDANNATSSLYNHFAPLRRFTYASFLYALSRATVYIITSFGFIWIVRYMGNFGISLFVLLALIAYMIGRGYFVRLELRLNHDYPFVKV